MQPIDRVTAIVQKNYKSILAYFLRHTHRDRDAEELAEDVVGDFFAHCISSGIPADPDAYLWQCAHNRLSDHCSAGSRCQPLPDAVVEIEAGEPSPVARAEFNEELALLLRAIEAASRDLPFNQRASFQMRYFFGYQHKDIAQKLGIPVNQVGQCLARAKRAVLAQLCHYRQHVASR